MKQLIQSYKTGELGLFEVPEPALNENGVLISTTASLVSAGTEKMIVDLAKKSLLGKAKARPDLVKQVINKMKQEGIKNTLEKVFTKLDSPIPLGYSCAGNILEIGDNVQGFQTGDRIACGGAGYANHSEINYIPKNLFVRIPDAVSDIDASFVTVGAIALQGVRQAEPLLGDKVAVIGLGLIGQITVQLLKANGCKVLGCDIDKSKLETAVKSGADVVCTPDELVNASASFSEGYGADSVIITASSKDSGIITTAGEIARMKGKVVVVGLVGMDIPRDIYYKKELDIRLSMSYGPGRYDPEYEEKGHDYPYAYVRWTEQRNFSAFLGLIEDKKLNPSLLITHEINFVDALKAYDIMEGKIQEPYLGIVLKYPESRNVNRAKSVTISENKGGGKLSCGLIGAGNFTKSVILPNIKKSGGYTLHGLCTATGVSAKTMGDKHGFSVVSTDMNELINNEDIDTMIITTRHDTHADAVVKSILKGKHVFVEKPLCITEEELSIIKEKYESLSEKPVVQVGFNRRFSPLIKKMKTAAGSGTMSINYRINAGVIPLDTWIQDKETGGGRIVGEVCHFIDTCSFLTGSDPVKVYADVQESADKSVPNEDNVSIIIKYENGSTATITYYADGNQQMPKEYIEVFSGKTSMALNDFRELTIFSGSGKKREKLAGQDKGFKNEFDAFKDAVLGGKEAISFQSIYLTTLTTFKILESIRTGSSVKIER